VVLGRDSLCESFISGLGRNLVFFVAFHFAVWCRGTEKTAKNFALQFTVSNMSELNQQRPYLRTGLIFGLDSREDQNIHLRLMITSSLNVLLLGKAQIVFTN